MRSITTLSAERIMEIHWIDKISIREPDVMFILPWITQFNVNASNRVGK